MSEPAPAKHVEKAADAAADAGPRMHLQETLGGGPMWLVRPMISGAL